MKFYYWSKYLSCYLGEVACPDCVAYFHYHMMSLALLTPANSRQYFLHFIVVRSSLFVFNHTVTPPPLWCMFL